MIDIKIGEGIGVEVCAMGTTIELASDICMAIDQLQKQMRSKNDVVADAFVDMVKSFVNEYNFKNSIFDNAKKESEKVEKAKAELKDLIDALENMPSECEQDEEDKEVKKDFESKISGIKVLNEDDVK